MPVLNMELLAALIIFTIFVYVAWRATKRK